MFYAMYPEFWIFCEKKIKNFGYIRNFENFDFINFFWKFRENYEL